VRDGRPGSLPACASRGCTVRPSTAEAAEAALLQGRVSTVFTSSTSSDGHLGGLSGADAQCQALADAAGLDGTLFR
jgi:hypothetical protein